MSSWLETQVDAHPEVKTYSDLAEYLNKKLWHQFGCKIEEATEEAFFQSEGRLLGLFVECAQKNVKQLNLLTFTKFGIKASKQHTDPKQRLAFLQSFVDDVKGSEDRREKQAPVLLNMEIASCLISIGELQEAKDMLDAGKADLDNYMGIMEAAIHSSYYRAALEYLKIKGPATDFFQNTLLYLTYTPLDSIAPDQQISLAVDAALAALFGKTIYNFGELLQHDIVTKLTGTEHAWLVELLHAFNKGDIGSYERVYAQVSGKNEDVKSQKTFLDEKIRIMALMELVFQKGAKDRNLDFSEVARACQLDVDAVEMMLMKAFSLELMRGQIDQVDRKVRIKWVQPRVLDKGQIQQVSTRLKEWASQIKATTTTLEDQAPELLSASAAS